MRLADDDEKWIRPSWTGLEARDSFADGVTVQWRAERGLLGFAVAGRTAPKAFSGWHYDYRKMESLAVEKATSDAATLGSAGQMFQAANRVAQQTPAAFDTSRARLMGVDGLAPQLQKESRRSLANAVVCRGTTLDQRLKAGDKVTIQGPLDASGDYGLISVVHVWTSAGYENRFVCTPASKFTHARAPQHPILYGVYRARVADNNDPEGLGRLRIQFFWQEENQSCWARVMSPYAGADYGMFLLPEIGDEVWIMFEEGDPERPRVIGSVWNGVHKPPREELWGGDVDPNHVKRIVTKSGHRITLNDKPDQSSIVVATPNHVKLQMIEGSNETGDSMLALHSDGDIVLSAPNGRVHFHCKDFSREVGGGGGTPSPEVQGSVPAPPTEVKAAPESALPATPMLVGNIDESLKTFSNDEKTIAEFLSAEGKDVRALPESRVKGKRTADAIVDGKLTEFKTMEKGGTDSTMKNQVSQSIRRGGQARNIVINAGGSGLSEEAAIKGLNRIYGISRGRLDSVRILGDGFDITRNY